MTKQDSNTSQSPNKYFPNEKSNDPSSSSRLPAGASGRSSRLPTAGGPPSQAVVVGAAGWTQAPWLLLKCGGGAARWPAPLMSLCCGGETVGPTTLVHRRQGASPTRRSAMTSPHKHFQSIPTPAARPAKTFMQFKRCYLQVLD